MDVVDEIVSQTLHGSLASELAVGTAEIGFMVEAPKRGAPIGVAAIGPRVRRLLPPPSGGGWQGRIQDGAGWVTSVTRWVISVTRGGSSVTLTERGGSVP